MLNEQNLLNQLAIKQYKQIADDLSRNPDSVEGFLELFFNSDTHQLQKLSHVLDKVKLNHPNLLKPYYSQWVKQLSESNSAAFLRNTYRYFQDVDIPEIQQGELYQLAFDDFQNYKNAIAIRVFAMTTCVNIAGDYPELLVEMKESIMPMLDAESPGIRSRASHLLKKINQLLE